MPCAELAERGKGRRGGGGGAWEGTDPHCAAELAGLGPELDLIELDLERKLSKGTEQHQKRMVKTRKGRAQTCPKKGSRLVKSTTPGETGMPLNLPFINAVSYTHLRAHETEADL
eukprot:2668075-Rhodomonas_salina.1